MRGLNSSRCAVGLWGTGLNFRWLWGVVESGRDRAQCRFVDEWNRNKTSRIKMCILSSVCVTYRWRHDFVRAARATPTWMDFVLSSFAPNCPCVVRLFFYSLYSSFVFLLDLFVSSRPHITLSTLLFLHGCKKKQKLAIICKLIVPTTFPVVRCPKSSPHHIFRIRFCFLTSVIYFLHFPLPLLPNSTPSPLPSPFTVPPIIHVLLGAHFPFSSESPWVLLLTSWSLVAFFTFSSFLITYI